MSWLEADIKLTLNLSRLKDVYGKMPCFSPISAVFLTLFHLAFIGFENSSISL